MYFGSSVTKLLTPNDCQIQIVTFTSRSDTLQLPQEPQAILLLPLFDNFSESQYMSFVCHDMYITWQWNNNTVGKKTGVNPINGERYKNLFGGIISTFPQSLACIVWY